MAVHERSEVEDDTTLTSEEEVLVEQLPVEVAMSTCEVVVDAGRLWVE